MQLRTGHTVEVDGDDDERVERVEDERPASRGAVVVAEALVDRKSVAPTR